MQLISPCDAIVVGALIIAINNILSLILVPTFVSHRIANSTVSIQAGRFLEKHIPHAKLGEPDRPDHNYWLDNYVPHIADLKANFTAQPTGKTQSTAGSRRMLATILFTDVVDSTSRASELGDCAWRELLQAHDATVRREIARFSGTEVRSLGDGFLVLFDGPAQAVCCAQAITEAMTPLGIQIRAGLHTGEVERTEADVLGIAVHLAARIMDTGNAGDVVISRTVKDLVAGSGIEFDDAGEHSLKGIEETWRLFKSRSAAGLHASRRARSVPSCCRSRSFPPSRRPRSSSAPSMRARARRSSPLRQLRPLIWPGASGTPLY